MSMSLDELYKLPRHEQRAYLQESVKKGLTAKAKRRVVIPTGDEEKYQWGSTNMMKGGGFSQ